jgi:RNA polymerase sigma-70 factor (ECF subfamily)
MTGMEDVALEVEGARRGEDAACRSLYRRFRPAVLRLLEGFGGLDRDDREDIVQETFTRAFRGVASLKAAAAFEGWLYTIARNRALTTIERKTRNERVHGDLAFESEDAAPAVPVALHAEIDGAVVRELIAALPEGPEKETVTLFYIEGQLSAREIADRLGVGKSAITMRLERFRARIKRDLAIRLTKARWE